MQCKLKLQTIKNIYGSIPVYKIAANCQRLYIWRDLNTFLFTSHVDRFGDPGAQTMYALGTLRLHGLTGYLLWEVTRATFISRLTYACQARWDLLDEQGRSRLESVLKKRVSCERLTGNLLNLRFSGWAGVRWDNEKPRAHLASSVATHQPG